MIGVDVLLFGVTGRIGRRVAEALVARGVRPRCAVRDPAAAAARLGDFASAVELVAADLAEPASLRAALRGGDRVFLTSPVAASMQAWQQAAIDAASACRPAVERIVKLSGSTWTQDPRQPTFSGIAHGRIEGALRRSGVASVAVRPGVFTDGFLKTGLARIGGGDTLVLPIAGARVAFAGLDTIAAVCADLLCAAALPQDYLEVGYPDAVDGDALAQFAAAALGRPIRYRAVLPADVLAAQRGRLTEFDAMHLRQMLEGIAGGRAGVEPKAGVWPGAVAGSVADFVATTLAGACSVAPAAPLHRS
ncbi:MAG: SDR family oxidoreductase [Lautropia sp.]